MASYLWREEGRRGWLPATLLRKSVSQSDVWSSLFVREVAREGDTRKWNRVRSYQDIPDLWSPITLGFPIFPRLIFNNVLNEMSLCFFLHRWAISKLCKDSYIPWSKGETRPSRYLFVFCSRYHLKPSVDIKKLSGTVEGPESEDK